MRKRRYAPTLYTDRHNMAFKVPYYHLRHEYKTDEQSIAPYQVRDPEAVITNDRCQMYWNFSFSTTTQLPHNKPDLVILDSLERKMYVIEMSCTGETNVADKENEKVRKYKDLMYDLYLQRIRDHLHPNNSWRNGRNEEQYGRILRKNKNNQKQRHQGTH
ncbi:hypothetical protein Trydic_g13082 [Trypoxylus dichotomus]